jgi:predicted esterase
MTDDGTAPGRPLLRFARLLLLAFYGIFLPFLLPPAVLLLAAAETGAGRAFGFALLLALGFPPSLEVARWMAGQGRRGPWPWIPALFCGGAPPVLYVILCATAVPGAPPPGSPAGSVFIGSSGFARCSPANVVPEIDQIKLGTFLVPAIDPILTLSGGARLRDVALPLYREMELDPAFHAMGSVMHHAYADLFGGASDAGHLYYYVPTHAPGERLPAVVFLHGSGGNFKSYLWAWKRLADRERLVIVSPSFGFGNWDRAGGEEAVERARTYAVDRLPVDANRIHLAGLSNGGKGVSRIGARHPERYRGLIFLSPVLEEAVVGSRPFTEGWRGRPLLVIHGARDDRVPEPFVGRAVTTLRNAGCRVAYRLHPDEDHFLFFSSLEPVLGEIAAWLRSDGRNRDGAEELTPGEKH